MDNSKQKKIIFIVGNLEEKVHASNKIIITVADSLAKMQAESHVIGYSRNKAIETVTQNGATVKSFEILPAYEASHQHMKNYLEQNNKIVLKLAYLIFHPINSFRVLFQFKLRKIFNQKIYTSYAKLIYNYAIKNDIKDAVVMGSEFAQWKDVFSYFEDQQINFYFYQLDPWGLNEMVSNDVREDYLTQELKVFELSKQIFTTSVLLNQYKNDERYLPFVNKMTVVEFPNVNPANETTCTFTFDEKYVNIIYCGILDDSYRSCSETVEKLLQNSAEKNLRFYFWGDIGAPSLFTLKDKYPQNIFINSKVPLSQAFALLQAGDVLLNIGNMFTNQVPSKIFDYVSFCKPILNIQKIENCPAKEYIKRYGEMAVTVPEYIKQWDTAPVLDFLNSAKSKTIDFQSVEKIYFDCTPTYVGNVFYKKIWGDL